MTKLTYLKRGIYLIMLVGLLLPLLHLSITPIYAVEPVEVHFFYSETCPHCHREGLFLDELENQYGNQIRVNRYEIAERGNVDLFKNFIDQYGASDIKALVVPVTFIGDDYYIGFDEADGTIGQGIIASIEQVLAGTPAEPQAPTKTIRLPFIGDISPSDYSLPGLAVVMGALDGFNVCSLGALAIILGITLKLKRRRHIFLYGGLFILTTGIIYGLLIGLWHQLFGFLGASLGVLRPIIGGLAIIGGLYFLKETIRMRKLGAVCKTTGASFTDRILKQTEEVFGKPHKFLYLGLAVIAFAAVITIVEFPCSAAVPLVFAGITAEAGVSGASYFFLMLLFLLFYLLDEILIFAIAVWKMKMVFTSPKFTVWATALEAVFLFAIGAYYLIGLV